jgi:hypothetical protein
MAKAKQPKQKVPKKKPRSVRELNESFDRLEQTLDFRRKVRKHAHGT